MVSRTFASSHLTRKQVEKLFGAGTFAYCSGRPLTEFLTIHFKLACVHQPHIFTSRFLKHANDWSRRNIAQPGCWIWVMENPPVRDRSFGGLHIHILLHVPFHLLSDFRRKAKRWIELAGGVAKDGALVCKPIRHSGPKDDHRDYLRYGLFGMSRYLAKGIDPNSAADFEVDPKSQGPISGRRCGHSEALSEQHRWLPVQRPGSIYTLGPDSARRRFAKAVCPELFEFPYDEDEEDW